MGFQDHLEKKPQPLRHHGAALAEDKTAAGSGRRKKKKAAAVWIALPPLRPIKVGRRRRGHGGAGAGEEEEEEAEEEEEVTTPTGEWCRIPAEAAACPPAPRKKQRTAVAIVGGDRRCSSSRDVDGEPATEEYFRVPADLEAVFAVVSRVAEAAN